MIDAETLVRRHVPPHVADPLIAYGNEHDTIVSMKTLIRYKIPPVSELLREAVRIDSKTALSGFQNGTIGKLTAAILAPHNFRPGRDAKIPAHPGVTAKTGALFVEHQGGAS